MAVQARCASAPLAVSPRLAWLALWIVASCWSAAMAAVPLPAAAAGGSLHRVLVLHSYHLGDAFADDVQDGVEQAFRQSGLRFEVFTEALDSNRITGSPEYLAQFAELLRLKYALLPFDVIVTCDNDALTFVAARRDALFPGVPVVFMGVNDYSLSTLGGRSDITGIAGGADRGAAVRMVLRVRPRTTSVVVVVDNTTTGRAERVAVEAARAQLPPGVSLRVLSLGDLTLEELGNQLAALPDSASVLLAHCSVDRLGVSYSVEDTTPYLSQRASVPVFVVSEIRVGLGAVGGLVSSGHAAGLTAGRMAVAVVSGTDIRTIPVMLQSPANPVFDYPVMRRFGLSPSDVPPESVILNRPLSILDQYRTPVVVTGIAFVTISAFLVLLALEVLRRRGVEVRLRKSQRALSGILDSIPQGIFWKDRQGVYLGANQVFARSVGIEDATQLVGKTDFDFVPSREAAEAYRADDVQIIESGIPRRHMVLALRRADGSDGWSDTTKLPLTDEAGEVHGVLGVFDDITDRRRAEEERARLLDQLQQSARVEAIGRLAGGVAHDFNNLLTAISGNVELARADRYSPDEVGRHLDEIQKASDSAASLTRQLLAFSRKQLIEPRVISLNDLIRHVQQMLVRLIGEDIALQTALAPDLGAVKVDPAQFEQALVNLAVNARDAMPDGGTLLIETANVDLDDGYCAAHPYVTPGPFVQVTVTDTGSGMTDEVKSRLFEPFFTTKPKERGTGLGLATTFGSIKQVGGSVEVYSEIGLGTTFKVYVPRVEGQPTVLPDATTPEPPPAGHETVLLVEDDPGVRALTVAMLTRLGYTVRQAASGGEALRLAEERHEPFDLLVTDVVMPGMNGRELAERMAALYPTIKVLFASGYTENVIVHRGLVDEQLNFISKPYSMRALAAKLREVLRS